jgi:hypothetical protein
MYDKFFLFGIILVKEIDQNFEPTTASASGVRLWSPALNDELTK